MYTLQHPSRPVCWCVCSCWQPWEICHGHPRGHLGLPGGRLTLGCSSQTAAGAGGAAAAAGLLCSHCGSKVPCAEPSVADSAEVQVGFRACKTTFCCSVPARQLAVQCRKPLSNWHLCCAVLCSWAGVSEQHSSRTSQHVCMSSKLCLSAMMHPQQCTLCIPRLFASCSLEYTTPHAILTYRADPTSPMHAVLTCRQHILAGALSALSGQQGLSSRSAADALAAVALLEGQDSSSALQAFLSARQQWVQQQLEQAAQGRSGQDPGQVLADLAQTVQSCIAQVRRGACCMLGCWGVLSWWVQFSRLKRGVE